MANPFEEDLVDGHKDNPLSILVSDKMSYSDIASKLINDNLLLTALELHTELIEAGREVPKLKEFFSNPGNFEQQAASRLDVSNSIRRSSSQVTLDSLDLTRFSEDGERGIDERVAVLEFELRKAKETISALRTNLTVAAESETTTPDSGTNKLPNNDSIKPHEQRALNFLLNEYLMLHNYKLTSITFADENEDQDFEDWDDVGLNIPKPAELLNIYRDYLRQTGFSRLPCSNASCQTEAPTEEIPDHETDGSSVADPDVHLDLLDQIERLKEHIVVVDQENQELQRQLALERLQEITSPTSDMGVAPANETLSLHSATPERFELIEAESKTADEADGRRDDDGNISLADTDTEWTRVALPNPIPERETAEIPAAEIVLPTALLHSPMSRALPARFQHEVFAQCFVNTAREQEKHQLDVIMQEDITDKSLVHILGDSLPRIIPNIILNKREEVLPLIIASIHLHPEAEQRDRLLHLLFNLKKRPQEEERLAILAGVVSLARCSGLGLVENEMLPQCWEQISHRHVERRLLVAESCSALAPYVSSPIRNSLMLSMLQQMLLEDKSDVVRESVIRSLSLIVTFIDDRDKYFQCEELALTALDDASAAVVSATTRLLLPVLAKWALDLGRLNDRLVTRLLDKTKDQVVEKYVAAMEKLVPYVLVSVVCVESVMKTIDGDTRSLECCVGEGLTDPRVFYEGEFAVGTVLGAFQSFVAQEFYEEWPELVWLVHTFLPGLLDLVEEVDAKDSGLVSAFIQLFQAMSMGLGSVATRLLVKPLFTARLQSLEKSLTSRRAGNEALPSLAIIPVFLVGVLAGQESEDLGPTLKRFLFGLPLCGCPLHALEASVRGLNNRPSQRDVVLAALWDAVVHPRPAVRVAAASLLVTTPTADTPKLLPALVTLANDADISVRMATVPAFGRLVTADSSKEVHDKTYMQLQSFLIDPMCRDDHGMQLQLVATLGHIAASCEPGFREEVILPQLTAMAAYTLQLSNLTKRLDLASVLVEAFSNVVYCTLTKQTINTALIPGLRYLEGVCAQCLPAQIEPVRTMLRSAESRVEPARLGERSSSISHALGSNVGQGMEDMKKRVSNIFTNTRPTNLPNLPGMFRKK